MKLSDFYSEFYSESISIYTLKKKSSFNKKCLFLDRDGVVIDEVNYINTPEKVKLSKNIIPFLEKAKKENFDIVVVTNQSGVSRGIISIQGYKEITQRILSFLPIEIYPDLILASFHLPNNQSNLDKQEWRKPGIGMFKYALEKYQYDISKSIMIGDKITDLIPADNCGFKELIFYPSELHPYEFENVERWNNEKCKKIKILNEFNAKKFF